MNKLIKINCLCVRFFEEKNIVSKFGGNYSLLLRPDIVNYIDVDPYIVKNTDIKVYRIVTSAIVGRGLNGVDAKEFYVTEDSYNKIVSNFEII